MVAKLAQFIRHNTLQHTTTNMSRCRCHPTLQRLSPLPPLVWQRRPQILAPCLPHECAQGGSHQVCARRFSSPCLGHPNKTHWLIERGGGPWPSVAAILIIHTTIKQKMALMLQWMLGRTYCQGGACEGMLSLCSSWQIKQQKRQKLKYVMALEGRGLIFFTQQPTKSTRSQQRRRRGRRLTRGGCTGGWNHCFGGH
jgi:hypothetical protein